MIVEIPLSNTHGCFTIVEAAARAYDAGATRFHAEYALLNQYPTTSTT